MTVWRMLTEINVDAMSRGSKLGSNRKKSYYSTTVLAVANDRDRESKYELCRVRWSTYKPLNNIMACFPPSAQTPQKTLRGALAPCV